MIIAGILLALGLCVFAIGVHAERARELLKSKFDLEIEVRYPIYDKKVATESTEIDLIEDSTSELSDYKG